MKKNNIYWGMIFIIMAALIVVNGLGLIEGVGISTGVCLATVNDLVR